MDNSSNVHVVWYDETNGEWGTDEEIMYANYTAAGWSNTTVISDVYGWNDGWSNYPSVAVDSSGTVHVVWTDASVGEWGGGLADYEIFYVNYTAGVWSNATCISDLYGWNDDFSEKPSVAVDSSGNIHVVWFDSTDGEWGTDLEIMYANMYKRPSANHPGDITTTILFSPAIYWQLYDETGGGQYRVWANDSNDNYMLLVNWTPWTNGTYIIVDIAMVGLGTFNYTIEYYNSYHQFGISDTVIVTITDVIPTPTKDEPIIIAPQGGGDISSFLLSPLGLGIVAGFGAILLILVTVIIKINKTVQELNKKISKTPTSKKAIEK
ncbi:MAG: hypothetical protein HWN67_01125 [Candidatus Helarchaeota archaeon]|nr:hypothetical protein [Candidatus Helarchaeota archaeon]